MLAGFYGLLYPRLQVVSLLLSPSNEWRKKTVRKKNRTHEILRTRSTRIFAYFLSPESRAVIFFLAGFFRASLDGLSESETTRAVCLNPVGVGIWRLVFKREDNRNTRRENLGAGREPTTGRYRTRPHWWKACKCTTALLDQSLESFLWFSVFFACCFSNFVQSQISAGMLDNLLKIRVIMIF